MTFSDEETSVVEIEEDSPDYGSGDSPPGQSQAQLDDGSTKTRENLHFGDNVSLSNVNIEKAEGQNKKFYLQLTLFLQQTV